jgi:predicted phosphate transport protein (TIGR00153 family)
LNEAGSHIDGQLSIGFETDLEAPLLPVSLCGKDSEPRGRQKMLFKKEKEVIDLIEKHAERVEACLLTAIDTLQAYLEDDITQAKALARKTDAIESEADLIRLQVRDRLYSGAYMPVLREDVYKLVESLDRVANAAEKCCDTFLNQRPKIPSELKPFYLDLIRASLGIGAPLKQAVLCYLQGICPVEVSRQYAKEVGLAESKVDSMEWDLTKLIFSSELTYGHKVHLRGCLDNIASVSDRAEDSADQLELVTLKAMN